MFQWWKKRSLEKKQRVEKKLKDEIESLKEQLKDSQTMYSIKTKQYDNFMLKAAKELDKVTELLKNDRTDLNRQITAHIEQIHKLNETIKDLKTKLKTAEEYTSTLKTTLGHF